MNVGKWAQMVVKANKAAGGMKAASVFKKVTNAARNTFNASRMKAAFERDIAVRATKSTIRFTQNAGTSFQQSWGGQALSKGIGLGARTSKKIANSRAYKTITPIAKKAAGMGLLTVGAVGMMGVSIMNGANNAAKDIILERYMADQRFSRDILMQSRLGTSMGTNRMNRNGGTIGLSNALSRTRHGASY